MEKFDNIVEQLGWIKPYSEIDLWYREGGEWYTCVFEMADMVSSTRKFEELLTEDVVRRTIESLPTTKFKEKNIEWILPMLVADYFWHKRDFEQELKWAQTAIDKNSKIEKTAFSKYVEERL